MDKINEFFINVKDRISSPLFFSFIISWLITNWKITLAIISYNQSEIQNAGYDSIFGFIDQHLSFNKYFGIPLLVAVLYTIFYPIIKNFIIALNTWASTWGEKWHLNISKEGKVGMDKFLAMRNKYSHSQKELEKIINEEETFRNENSALKLELNSTEKKLIKANDELLEERNYNAKVFDHSILNGEWEVSYQGIEVAHHRKEYVLIDNKSYYIVDVDGNQAKTHLIENFCFDEKHNRIILTKVFTEEIQQSRNIGDPSLFFQRLKLKTNSMSILEGVENNKIKVTYKKISREVR